MEVHIEVDNDCCDEFFGAIRIMSENRINISADTKLNLQKNASEGHTIITVTAHDPLHFYFLGTMIASTIHKQSEIRRLRGELKEIQDETSEKISKILNDVKNEQD